MREVGLANAGNERGNETQRTSLEYLAPFGSGINNRFIVLLIDKREAIYNFTNQS